jgi:hypothetical protein
MTDKLELWLSSRKYTPEKLAIARQVLDEVRSGSDVLAAIRRHPLPGGGHVAKHAWSRSIAPVWKAENGRRTTIF